MSDQNHSTSTGDGAPLSSKFLEFCVKMRNSDPSILPEPDAPLRLRLLSKKEDMELADALLDNTASRLELKTDYYTKSSAEAMTKFVRTSKRLQRIRLTGDHSELQHVRRQREEMFNCFLPAIQQSTSLKELSRIFSSANLALETCWRI
jgi:hypothetical protein